MENYNEILSFINGYKEGSFVYPRVIKRHFNIDGLETYKILEDLVDKNILQRSYQLQCSGCGHSDNIFYEALNQISDLSICGCCRSKMNSIKDTIVFYKKK